LQAEKNGQDAIIESIRTVGEVEALKKKSDFLLQFASPDRDISPYPDYTLHYSKS